MLVTKNMIKKKITINLFEGKNFDFKHVDGVFVSFKIPHGFGEIVQDSATKSVPSPSWNEEIIFDVMGDKKSMSCSIFLVYPSKEEKELKSITIHFDSRFVNGVPVTLQNLVFDDKINCYLKMDITVKEVTKLPKISKIKKRSNKEKNIQKKEKNDAVYLGAKKKKGFFKSGLLGLIFPNSPEDIDSFTRNRQKSIKKLEKDVIVINKYSPVKINGKHVGEYIGYAISYKGVNNFVPTKYGSMIFPNKRFMYEGEFSDGLRHGRGSLYKTSNPNVMLRGKWNNNQPTGNFTVHYPNGEIYEGTFVVKASKQRSDEHLHNLVFSDFQREGLGSLLSKDKNEFYFGLFVKDKRSGLGICDHYTNGVRLLGMWKNDLFVSGVKSYLDGSLFFGGFKENKRSGQGYYCFSDGSRIEGTWSSVNTVEKATVFSGNLKSLDETVLRMVYESVKEQLNRKSGQHDIFRSRNLWVWLLDADKLEKQVSESSLKKNFNEIVFKHMVEESSGYLNRFLNIFCKYFNSLYSLDLEKNVRNKLLYAKDDVTSFLFFIEHAFFEILMEVQSEKKKKKKELKYSFRHEIKPVIRDYLTEYIHKKIYLKFVKLYQKEYIDKEILLKQKIKAINFALKSMTEERKMQFLKKELYLLLPEKDYEILEIDGLKNLINSLYSDCQKNERSFLDNMFKSLKLRVEKLKQNVLHNTEIAKVLPKQIRKFCSLCFDKQNIQLTKESLSIFIEKLKSTRIGLISVFGISKLDKIEEMIKILKVELKSRQEKSFFYQTRSLDLCYKYLKEIILSNEKVYIEVEQNHYNSIIFNLDSIIWDLEAGDSNYQTSIFNLIPESIEKKLNSLKSCINMKIFSEVKKVKQRKINQYFELLKVFINSSMDQKKLDILNDINVKFEKIFNEDFKLECIKKKWNGIYNILKKLVTSDKKRFSKRHEIEEKTIRIIILDIDKIGLKSIVLELELLLSQTKSKIKQRLIKSVIKRAWSIIYDIEYLLDEKSKIQQIMAISFINFKQRIVSIKLILKEFMSRNKFDHCFKIMQISHNIFNYLIQKCKYMKLLSIIKVKHKEIINKKKVIKEKNEEKKMIEESMKKKRGSKKGIGKVQSELYKLQDDKIKALLRGKMVLQNEKTELDKIKLIESLKVFEKAVFSLSMSLEINVVCSEFEKFEKKLNIKEVISLIEKSKSKFQKKCISRKIDAVELGLKNYKDFIQEIDVKLEILGIPQKLIPKDEIPYKKSIDKLNELKIKNSISQKLDVLKEFEVCLLSELKKVDFRKFYEEDYILPITLFCFIKSDLDLFSEYHYLSDWSSNVTQMLTRFEIFLNYINELNIHAKDSSGQLLSTYQILKPIRERIDSWEENNKNVEKNIHVVVNLLNFIYIEIGFLKENTLRISTDELKKSILKNLEEIQFYLNVKTIGFSILIDTEFDDQLIIDFGNQYPANLYKKCAEEITKKYIKN